MTGRHDRMPPRLLDAKALVARRNEAGLSRRQLAVRVGVSHSTIRLLERDENHDVLTLGLVGRICDVLGVQLGAVLADSQGGGGGGPDERLLEAALAEHRGGLVHRSDLEHSFGWDRRRFTEAAERLDKRLIDSGQVLHRSGWGKYALRARADAMSKQQRETMLRLTGVDRKGLTLSQAGLLRDIRARCLTEQSINNAPSTRIAVSALQKQGLVEPTADGAYRPVDEVDFSLDFGSSEERS